MANNICTECGTENEEKYLYCKNCGMPIKSEGKKSEPEDYQFSAEEAQSSSQQPPSDNGSTVYNTPNGVVVDSIDGIPQEEMALFIGKKAYEILPKFSKMELTRSKVSWCWPAAVLSFLFGPAGASLWFFYRKMYKPAIILSVIGAVLTVITSVMTVGGSDMNFEAFFNSFFAGDYNTALESIQTSNSLLSMIADFVNEIAGILSCILCGLFGYHLYKEHCVNKILTFKTVHADRRYYRLGLASIGGVSGGMMAVGLLIMVCASNAASIISVIISMI